MRICSGVHTGVRADALIDAWIEEALDIGVFYMGMNILRFLLLFFFGLSFWRWKRSIINANMVNEQLGSVSAHHLSK